MVFLCSQVVSELPIFRTWAGGFELPASKKLMPELPPSLREALTGRLQLDALDENRPSLVALLERMGLERLSISEVARETLQQSKAPEVMAELLRANLFEAFRDVELFVTQGGQLLKSKSCLLWDCESEFDFIPRRMDQKLATNFQDVKAQLKTLEFRTELDLQDVLDLAKQAQDTGDVALSQKLIH